MKDEEIETITNDEALRRIKADPKDYRAWMAICTMQVDRIKELELTVSEQRGTIEQLRYGRKLRRRH